LTQGAVEGLMLDLKWLDSSVGRARD
jgi:hypothetical protein